MSEKAKTQLLLGLFHGRVPHETQLKPFFAFDETIFRLPHLNSSLTAGD